MKNKVFGLIALAVSSFGLIMNASAVKIIGTGDGADGRIDYEGSNITLETIDAEKKEYKLVLAGAAQEDLIILDGETVTVDLAGNTWTNNNAKASAFDVQAGATLIITDSKTGGKITYSESSEKNTVGDKNSYAPLIANAGTVTIQGGIIEVNKGESGVYATGILNKDKAKLTVKDGHIETKVINAWGITNEGEAFIEGGTFVQGKDFSIIDNAKTLHISGGKFTVTPGDTHNSLITNADEATPVLEISGGDFSDTNIKKLFHKSTKVEENTDIVLTGGTYPIALKEEIEKYMDKENYEINEDGMIITDADYTKLNAAVALAEEKIKEKEKYTAESIKALEEALKVAKEVAKDLKTDKQSDIDTLEKNLTNAISGLKLIEEENDEDDNVVVAPDDPTLPENPATGVSLPLISMMVLGVTGVGIYLGTKSKNKFYSL